MLLLRLAARQADRVDGLDPDRHLSQVQGLSGDFGETRMTLRAIFEAQLNLHDLAWCRGCEIGKSHSRGFVLDADLLMVHLDSEIGTRSSLHRGLHEIAHCILDERGLRRYECEAQANQWAARQMRELGVSVPRKVAGKGRAYVRRMKRWGKNIRKGRKS